MVNDLFCNDIKFVEVTLVNYVGVHNHSNAVTRKGNEKNPVSPAKKAELLTLFGEGYGSKDAHSKMMENALKTGLTHVEAIKLTPTYPQVQHIKLRLYVSR